MSIPPKTTVLVVGGGPGGSYTASVLAREGIDTVLLEAEKFPRYHIGESMLPSFRKYLRFIDCDEEFNRRGFIKKVGAAFKLRPENKAGYTDFIAAGGPDSYAWNVVRSEADDILFQHARKSGANAFDGVKVNTLQFETANGEATEAADGSSRPVSATYTVKETGEQGTIAFEYLVDASGRAGLLNTKYLKNRRYNTALKNVAHWAYYENAGQYEINNAPFFEALRDESGWAWFIPLHSGKTSVGIVRHQSVATERKRATGSMAEYFDDALTQVPMLTEILGPQGTRVTDVQTASDYSYHSATYTLPHARVVGDAGCFIDPFFSSGVHLALTGGLSAATTICAAIRGDTTEEVAANWHNTKVREGYARFLLVVLAAYKQMLHQKEDVLSDFHEDNFDRAFSFFRPVIQGTVDVSDKITRAEFEQTLEFLTKAFDMQLVQGKGVEDLSGADKEVFQNSEEIKGDLVAVADEFTTDVINGRVPKMERGGLTLVEVRN